jgi:hypothetical protein
VPTLLSLSPLSSFKFKGIDHPTYKRLNKELFLDKPLHVILNKSILPYRIYVILLANKEFKKKFKGVSSMPFDISRSM